MWLERDVANARGARFGLMELGIGPEKVELCAGCGQSRSEVQIPVSAA